VCREPIFLGFDCCIDLLKIIERLKMKMSAMIYPHFA
jgi:hypothetical protein